jgi:phage FluMu protein Com
MNTKTTLYCAGCPKLLMFLISGEPFFAFRKCPDCHTLNFWLHNSKEFPLPLYSHVPAPNQPIDMHRKTGERLPAKYRAVDPSVPDDISLSADDNGGTQNKLQIQDIRSLGLPFRISLEIPESPKPSPSPPPLSPESPSESNASGSDGV